MVSPVHTTIVHASSVVVGTMGILIRGPSGSGKTTLMMELINQSNNCDEFACVICDDQTGLSATNDQLIAHRIEQISDQLEVRGFGILSVKSIDAAIVHVVVDLIDPTLLERMPETNFTNLESIEVRNIKVPIGDEIRASRMIKCVTENLD